MNRVLAGLSIVLFAACSMHLAQPEAVPAEEAREHLEWLRIGSTTREDVLLRMGTPTTDFEGGRLMTYLLHDDEATGLEPLPRSDHFMDPGWAGYGGFHWVEYDLVLVFSRSGVLQRYQLLAYR